MPNPPLRVAQGTTEADVDQVNIWMRNQPWYQQLLTGWGMDPAHPGKLSESRRTQILRAAQANGVVVDEGHDEVDAYGNFDKKGHALRNTLIVAGIVGASIATMGAAGVFGGAAGTVTGTGLGTGSLLAGEGVTGAALGGSAGAALGAGAAGWGGVAGTAAATGAAGGAGAAGAGGAAAAAGAASRIPWQYVIPAVSSGIGGVMANRQQNKQNELTALQLENQRKIQEATLGLDESKQDPYRGQMFQQKDLAHLDLMANADVSPATVTSTSRYAATAPKINPGFSWSPSAALKLGAAAAQRDVASGRGAPSVVPSRAGAPPPTNTALDLSSTYAGAPPAATPPPVSRPALPGAAPTDPYNVQAWLDEMRKKRAFQTAAA